MSSNERDSFFLFSVDDAAKPLKYLYDQAKMSYWVAEDIDMSQDLLQWNKLSPELQRFLIYVLAFFFVSDGVVFENLVFRFAQEVSNDAKPFYAIQIAMEMIHAETYSKFIEVLVTDRVTRDHLTRTVEEFSCVQKKMRWAAKWFASDKSFATRLLAFVAVEGIFFSGSFCAIFYLRTKPYYLRGLRQANEYIARDEGLHCRFACEYYKQLEPLPVSEVYGIIKEAVFIEKEFFDEALAVPVIGMNKEMMADHIKYVADYWLQELGYPRLYNVEEPFDFMNLIALQGKTNFFERRPTEYSKGNIAPGGSTGLVEIGTGENVLNVVNLD